MLVPWTQSVALWWRPELRFYERRFEILRTLEERGAMWAFRAPEGMIEARLFDTLHQLAVHQDRAALHLLSPDANEERAWEAFALALDEVQPKRPVRMEVAFQFVAEVAQPFEETVVRGHGAFLGWPGSDSARVKDWAVLVDLELTDPLAARGRLEYGIVRDHEIPARLERSAGRAGFSTPPTIVQGHWDGEAFPEVAVFADLGFSADFAPTSTVAPAVEAMDALQAFWHIARTEASSLVSALKARVEPDDKQTEEVAL